MSNLDLPSVHKFKKDTSAGLLSTRPKHLKSIDEALSKYHKATSDYGRRYEAESARIALDQLMATEWKSRDKKGAITALDRMLPPQKPPPSSSSANVQMMMENNRKGVLYFLANVSLSKPAPAQVAELASDVTEFGESAKELLDTGGGKELLGAISIDGFARPFALPETPPAFAATLISALEDLVSKLVSMFPGDDAATAASEWLVSQLPELVCDMLGSVVPHLSAVGAVGGRLFDACKAGVHLLRTRNLEGGILEGHPKIVIEAIREAIEGTAFEALGRAVLEVLMAGIAVATPAIESVANAVRTIVQFTAKAFFYFRELTRIKKVIGKPARALLDSQLHQRAEEFNEWLRLTIASLPIISCYILGMPMTGSMYGFLSLVSTKGGDEDMEKALTMNTLKENAKQLELLKKRARGYIANHSVLLFSADPVVDLSLKVARGEEVRVACGEEVAH